MAKRRIKRNQKLNMTVKDIETIRLKATVEAVQMTHYFPLLILRDKHEMGEVRLSRFQKQYSEIWDKYNTGNISLTQIVKEIREKAPISFEERTDISHRYLEKSEDQSIVIKKRDLDKIRKNARYDAFLLTSHFPLYILMKEWKFGKDRLIQFHSDYYDLWDSIDKGYLDLSDIKEVLKEEVNITWIED